MEHFEKHGAALRPDRQMEAFREALEDCQLSDLGFIGSKFTWYNNREDEYFTKAWLDRVVTNPDWCEKFGETYVFVLAARSSDHCPFFFFFFFLNIGNNGVKDTYTVETFKFEANWMVNDACSSGVKDAWKDRVFEGDPLDILVIKLEQCKQQLMRWSKWNGKRRRSARLKNTTKRRESLQSWVAPETMGEINENEGTIDDMLERED